MFSFCTITFQLKLKFYIYICKISISIETYKHVMKIIEEVKYGIVKVL